MTAAGLAITCATVAVLLAAFLRRRRAPLPRHGPLGIGILLAAALLLVFRIELVTTYFTPIAWTAYILIADAAVLSVAGRSRLHDEPAQFAQVALLSIPLWLIFEGYNLRLENWTYVGVPPGWPGLLGYAWSFATITPAIFVTADLVESLGWFRNRRPLVFSGSMQRLMVVFGATCLLLPLMLPQRMAAYLFALVWVGFVFLLDRINYRLGLPSLLGDFARGRFGRFWSLLIAGWVCGWLWEFWNYWATARWLYIFPMFQQWKIFEMPAPGYLGFLPFALECFTMYVTAAWLVRTLAVKAGIARGPAWGRREP